jgi:tetratricopeptide (TPR) repeat protein
MTPHVPSGLRDLQQWLSESTAEAELLLPELLDIPAPELRRELRARPELRTPGMMRHLLAVAHDALDRFPSRAHELTAIVVHCIGSIAVPRSFSSVVRMVRAEAWREHASALRGIGRLEKARHAVRTARALFADMPASGWHLATVDLVEAPLLHDLGHPNEALQMIRAAAPQFAMARDHARYLQACMLEAWMLVAAGDPAGAAELWRNAHELARQHGDVALMGHITAKLGLLELRHGSADDASQLLVSALQRLDAAGVAHEAIRARWHLAEALAARGRAHEAVSEYHKVRAQLLAEGSLIDAAIASAEILLLLLDEGRETELSALTTNFVHSFRDAGLPLNAIEPFAYLRGRAEAGLLAHEDAVEVRRWFEDLRQHPLARFTPTR